LNKIFTNPIYKVSFGKSEIKVSHVGTGTGIGQGLMFKAQCFDRLKNVSNFKFNQASLMLSLSAVIKWSILTGYQK
jgi:hypothetical protein